MDRRSDHAGHLADEPPPRNLRDTRTRATLPGTEDVKGPISITGAIGKPPYDKARERGIGIGLDIDGFESRIDSSAEPY